MDLRERIYDPEEQQRTAWDAFRSTVWTSMPGIIKSYDATTLTCQVRVAITAAMTQKDPDPKRVNNTVRVYKELPLLLDCPVVFPHGGGCSITFPLVEGDEVLVHFASRCIDKWWALGGVQEPMEPRMHDLSDAIVTPGPFSQAKKISNVSTTHLQIRSNDGSTYVELDPAGQVVNVVAPGGMSITTPKVTITGKLVVTDTIGANGKIASLDDVGVITETTTISLKTHKHSGVQTGGSQSGPPVAV